MQPQNETTLSTGQTAMDDMVVRLDDDSIGALYEHIREIARRFRSTGFYSDSIGATDLAHESLARMLGGMEDATFASPRHLLNTASKVMYRLLVDRLRRRKLRAGALDEIARQQMALGSTVEADTMAAFADELNRLDQRRPQAAEVLRYRFFFRMTLDEMAKEMDCTVSAVRQELAFARAFLKKPGHLFDDLEHA